ncbi:hypothetical protein GPECTOR_109g208 [Gonium pectorale]|uniref:Uncharacterized protein n=1 Tax=Gonium pectorale TaxID=33097 RepID=A0A150G0I4_GONPE|nr:hypothetical protein GPECTOR_109g208 [Gonium pectorale]|eukprot:KXZ42965.1 hypothetical protein GPECTOR_109g208 [Gonium pectorale]
MYSISTVAKARQPLNQKKKQKRVDAAAAAAAAPKPKLQPKDAKPKDAKTTGAGAAMAAMKPAGEAVLRQAGVAIGSVKTVNAAKVVGAAPPGSGAAARIAGAVVNNESMAPERVVRQRNIPGWSPGDKPKNMSTLEQQRAMVAALRAQAKEEATRGNKATAAAAAAKAAAATAAGAGGRGGNLLPAGGSGRLGAGQPQVRQQLLWGDDDEAEGADSSEDGEGLLFGRYQRDDASSDSPEEPGLTAQQRDFQLAQEDFPAFPKAAGAGASASASATPTKRAAAPPATPPQYDVPAPTPASALSSSGGAAAAAGPSPDGAQLAAPAAENADEEDPIIATDPVFATDDGTVVVQDAYGNYLRMEDVYGPNPELIGLQDEHGVVSYHVVIRQSALAAQQQLLQPHEEAESPAAAGNGTAAIVADAASGVYAGMTVNGLHTYAQPEAPMQAQALAPTFSATGMLPAVGSNGALAPEAPSPAPAPAPALPAAAALAMGQCMVQGAGAADDEEGDLGDLLALCMGGSGGGAPAPAAPSPAAYMDPAAAAQHSHPHYQQQPEYLPPQQPQHVYGGYPMYGKEYGTYGGGVAAAPAPAPAAPEEELDDLMQLLCV